MESFEGISLKISISKCLQEFMQICEYNKSRTFTKTLIIFDNLKPSRAGEAKICLDGPCHTTIMAAMPTS